MKLKSIFFYLAILVSVIFIAIVGWAATHGGIWNTTPWIAHNAPHGFVGWIFTIGIFLWMAFFITPKRKN